MNQEFPIIEVTPVGNGVYLLFSLYAKESVALTAQAFIELSTWIAEHSETLDQEAQQEAAEHPPGASILLSQR
jgi:hypothetical protein